MRKSVPFLLVIVVCAAALVASALLLVDYVRPSPVFCATDGGCGLVKKTAFAYPMGIPTPLFGIGGFLAIGLAQLLPGRRAQIVQAMLAVFGGIVAAGLLIVQASMKTICPFCAVADISALVLAGLSIMRAIRGWDPPAKSRRPIVLGAFAMIAAVVVPVSIGMSRRVIPADVPAVIADEMRATGRGRVTVVDFVDFECPFCRATHAEFSPLLAARKDKVRVARKHVPLRMHKHALDAARTACCGEKMGKGDEIAEALFTAPTEDLTPEGCEQIALKHGLDITAFRDCLKDPSTELRIRADGEAFRAAQGHGLPTIFIDNVKLEGAQEREELERALDGAVKAL